MGILDSWRARTTRRNIVIVRSAVASWVGALDAAEMYRTQPALRAVVSFMADNIACLPLKVYRMGDKGRTRDRESAMAQLIARPSSVQTTYEFVASVMTDLKLYGRALAYVSVDADAPSGWTMLQIPAAWVVGVDTLDGFTPSRYKIDNPVTDAAPKWFDAADFIEFRHYDPYGGAVAGAPIDALKQVLTEQISAWAFRNSVWKNGGWVNRYLYRPANAPDWSPEARERFARSWKSKFAGGGDNANAGESTDTGGTPLLEDGMELRDSGFNAREAQWVEATRIAREDVAAVYHINPSLIWHTDAQTYASAKDNARALYAEALAPDLAMISQRLNAELVKRLGVPADTYCEFDLQAKLQGSFEEQASVLQSSVGRPWMTVDEARSRLNLPPIDGGSELTVPLNVLVGGLASPNDTDPTSGYNAGIVQAKSTDVDETEPATVEIKSSGKPTQEDADALAEAIRKFTKRQRKRVLQDMDKAAKAGAVRAKADGDPDWFDSERWNRELAEDIEPILLAQATKRGRRSMRDLGGDSDWFDDSRIADYIAAMAVGKATAVNAITLKQLMRTLDESEDMDESNQGATAAGVFDMAEGERADRQGVSFATAVAGWAALEACRQVQTRKRRMKRWVVNSSNPRASHAAMDGETVEYDQQFSNGANYPGDWRLPPDESCNCQCSMEVVLQ